MIKQYFLRKTILFILVLFCGVVGDLKAQTNLITNPGFDTNTSSFLVDGTTADQSPAVINQLRRITSTTSITTTTSLPTPASPASASVSVTDGLWVKKQTFTASNMYCQLSNSSGGAGNNVAGANSTTNCMFMKIGGGNGTTGIDWTKFATQQKLSLDNTKKYTFTFYAKASWTSTAPTGVAYIADMNGNTVGAIAGVPFYKTFTPTGSFVKYTASFDLAYAKAANANLDFSTAYVGIGWNPTYTNATPSKTENCYLYIDEFSLSESTTPVITSSSLSPTDLNPIPITITFNNAVTGFTSSDLVVSNGIVSGFSGSGASYTANIIPTSQGAVTVDIAAGAATDGLSNATLAATQFSRAYTAYYRSAASGNWGTPPTWESSVDNSNWATATSAPTSSAASVTIQNGHLVTVTANATAPTLIVQGGGKLTLNDTYTLNANSLTLQGHSTNGTATFVDKTTNGVGLSVSGTTSVQQYLTTGRNWYVSSPVASATSNVFGAASSSTNKLYWYNEPQGSSLTLNWPQITDNATALSVARGYIVNMPADGVVTFTGGNLNTGAITTGVNSVPALTRTTGQAKEGFNLVGNPYASYLDWNSIVKTNVDATMWYRTNVGGTYKFYTYLTGTGALEEDGITVPAGVSNLIPPMQGFWVRVSSGQASGSLSFTNAMRAHKDATGNVLKVSAAKKSVNQLVRLQVSNGVNDDEAVIYFNPNVTNGFDSYDSPKMTNGNNAIPEIYTLVGSEQLVINGMNAIPYNTELPLGFKTGATGSFTLKATEINNFDSTTTLVLKDKELKVEQELVSGMSYSFPSDVVNSTTRFSLIFRTVGATAELNGLIGNNRAVICRADNNHIVVNCMEGVTSDADVQVYNLIGEKLISKRLTGVVTIIDNTLSPGAYLVTVSTGGKSFNQKIILN